MSSVRPVAQASPIAAAPARALRAAGQSDPGTSREVNEDRFHCDPERGVFLVIDGVGGQAAGGRAADVALSTLRQRLTAGPGAAEDRIRRSITLVNNEIHRLASTRAEWRGMACVLTVALVEDRVVTFGHVGDTRLYKLTPTGIQKLTPDHSPVGEREDAGDLSELEAMRHPRRNEVYRDVGSEPHSETDPDFVDIGQATLERDSALLLCSDGLTDLIDSPAIVRTVQHHAGDPGSVVRALIDAANAAGGHDNVTVVYVEGEEFAPARSESARPGAAIARRRRLSVAALLLALGGTILTNTHGVQLATLFGIGADRRPAGRVTVAAGGSIGAALADAVPGTEVVVEPGEYREQLTLRPGVRVISRVPRAAILRVPAAREAQRATAVVATGIAGAELIGFTISGDSATPLAVGVLVERAAVSIVDVEIAGAARAAVEFSGAGDSSLVGSELRDNPGAALVVRDGARPRVTHSSFLRNATSEEAAAAIVVQSGAMPVLSGNVFATTTPRSFTTLDDALVAELQRDNWFVAPPQRRDPAATIHPPATR